MLAVRRDLPFSDPEWAFEPKWDGVRALAYWDGERLTLRSRRGRDITPVYPELVHITPDRAVVLDGEIIALAAEGRPSFGMLQNRMNVGSPDRATIEAYPVHYMVFDLLYDREPIIEQPWTERRERLEKVQLGSGVLVEPVVGEGEDLWLAILEQRLEGMVAKRLGSTYQPGIRSYDWLKVPRTETVRAVVGGWVMGERSRASTFGSLLLGLVDGDRLRYIGSVGTGFDNLTLRAIRGALDEMAADRSPFHPDLEMPTEIRFVTPHLVALVEFKEWTRTDKLRAPSFKGFTDDRWDETTWESEGP
jgi:bifunctional non-homologous end joining protein LigD